MEKIQFDYSELKGRIKAKCDSQKVFAEKLGITESTLTSKLNGYTYFTPAEIVKSAEILDIERVRLSDYFFTVKVG